MDATKAALFEQVLKQVEAAESGFERTAAELCSALPDGPQRLADLMTAHRAALDARVSVIQTESAYPGEFPVFAQAWSAARNAAPGAATLPTAPGATRLRGV